MLIPEGWVILYYDVKRTAGRAIYRLGIVLLDKNNPTKILRRSDERIFGSRELYERVGDIDYVVFLCGWIVEGDEIRLYYGAADTSIALATQNLNDLRNYVLNCPVTEEAKRWC